MSTYNAHLVQQHFGLVIIGDEILSGHRQDKHLSKVIELFNNRGMRLSWVHLLPDDFDILVDHFKRSLNSDDIVISCGGIGATPDDKTREAVATALGRKLELHPEAAKLITHRFKKLAAEGRATDDPGSPENQRRLAMGLFPQGAEIVPNPYNQIPGFYIKNHTFVPGFPEMAWPMIEWTLDERYKAYQHIHDTICLSIDTYYVPESRVSPLLEEIELRWPMVKTFSLPSVSKNQATAVTELGVKGPTQDCHDAFDYLKSGVLRLGGHFHL